MRVEINREGREIARQYEPDEPEKSVIEEDLCRFRREVASMQREALAKIEVRPVSEVIEKMFRQSENEEGELEVEWKGKYVGCEGEALEITGTGSEIVWVTRDIGSPNGKVIEAILVINGDKAIDLIELVEDWGVSVVFLLGEVQKVLLNGSVMEMAGAYQPEIKAIGLRGLQPMDVLAHEAGHQWQHHWEVKGVEKINWRENYRGGQGLKGDSKKEIAENNLFEWLKEKMAAPTIYQQLLLTNIKERNADAFAVGLVRRCRELGVPIANDKALRDRIRIGRSTRKFMDHYVSRVIARAKNEE